MIAGSLKGRRLHAPSGLRVRPTSDRAREGLFDILGQYLQGERFLDLFAGTGAVGIEAHSRGADAVVLVESDRDALAIIDRNIESMGITREIEIVPAPWPRALSLAAQRGGPFSIVFADPPYSGADYEAILSSLATGSGEPGGPAGPRPRAEAAGPARSEEPARMGSAAGAGLLARDPLIVLEHEERAAIPEKTGEFRLVRRAAYSRVAFGFYRFVA